MAHMQLEAYKRNGKKAQTVRQEGYIPAVVYGPAMPKNSCEEITLEYQVFRKVFRDAGESTVIELTVEGKMIPVLVHSMDQDPVTGQFTHVDFYAMNMQEEVHTHIPLTFVGNAPVVKEKNGVLVTSKESLEVKCLPKNLVHDISVDISGLVEFHDHILVQDISIPEGITVLDKPEDTVIIASPPKKEVVEETGAPEATVAEVGTETDSAEEKE